MKTFKSKLKSAFIRALGAFEAVQSDKGELIFAGDELVVGIEVYVVDEAGVQIPAPDGDYTVGADVVVVADGKVESITPKEVTEEFESDDSEGGDTGDGLTLEALATEIEALRAELAALREMVVEQSNDTVEVIEDFAKQLQKTPMASTFTKRQAEAEVPKFSISALRKERGQI